ncbi:Ankyrin repeats (3 copies) [Carpediemonas membranifera]|uniref:Ankyrin repeats (3 copies) n=1 Tax=Carpediemonas membranifera TaxID=201153 RepID=A0A8J6AYE7_9EUKA|nr:Ankyrin repeats (3 copies) [Carpediemonas membranifera]|eukprot:KAG9391473.1 Ankyrin repeats (3 copies) [Carpediemonas membranifera]
MQAENNNAPSDSALNEENDACTTNTLSPFVPTDVSSSAPSRPSSSPATGPLGPETVRTASLEETESSKTPDDEPQQWSPLFEASVAGNVDLVRDLLQAEADPDLRGAADRTPLIATTIKNNTEIIELLINAGAALDLQDDDGDTALMAACIKGHTECVSILIKAGADCNKARPSGHNALHMAAENGSEEIAKLLLDADQSILDGPDSDGWTPLFAAAVNGHTGVARLLLEHGADPELCANDGKTILMAAFSNGHTECASVLIEAGVDCTKIRPDGASALYLASYFGHADVVKLLLDTTPDMVDVAKKTGFSPLHAASMNGHAHCARLLLENGADVDRRDRSLGTPLMEAADNGHTEAIKLLIDAGATLDLRNKKGCTALLLTCRGGHVESAQELLNAGANAAYHCSFGTCLTIATYNGLDDIIMLLLQSGADVNAAELGGLTPLHWAAKRNRVTCARLLLQAGCDVDARGPLSRTAVFIAAREGYTDVVKLLVAAGADLAISGRTSRIRRPRLPRDIAQTEGHTDCVDLLDHPELCGPLDFEVGSLATRPVRPPPSLDMIWTTSSGYHYYVEQVAFQGVHPLRSGLFASVKTWYWEFSFLAKSISTIYRLSLAFTLRPLLGYQAWSSKGDTAFHEAVRDGDVTFAGLVAFAGKQNLINQPTDDGATPLYIACVSGETKSVRFLLNEGADPNVRTNTGRTPLIAAVFEGFTTIIGLLLDAGADCTVALPSGCSALHIAADRGFVDIAEMLLNADPDMVDVADDDGWSPLHTAAYYNQDRIVALLIKAGATLDLVTEDERTPLHLACNHGRIDSVMILLAAGASTYKSSKCVTCLGAAAFEGHDAIVHALLQHGADVNATSAEEWTALHWAAKANRVTCVHLLLQAGCEVDAHDKLGFTATFHAAIEGHFDVLRLLIAAGANPYLSVGTVLPRDIAKANNHKMCVNLLDHPEDYSKIAVNVGSFVPAIAPIDASIPPAKDKVVVLASVYMALYTDADVPRASRLLAEFKSASSPDQLRKLASQIQEIQTDIDRLTPVLSLAKDPMPALKEKDRVREALERSDAFHAHVISGNVRRIRSKPLFRRDKFGPVVLNCLDREGRSPLYNAFISGQAKVFAALLKTGGLVDDAFPDGHPLLAIEGRPAMCDAILKAKVDINLVNRGTTALVAAIQGGREGFAHWLLDHGADPLLPLGRVNALHAAHATPFIDLGEGVLNHIHRAFPQLQHRPALPALPHPPLDISLFQVLDAQSSELHDGFALGNARYRNNAGGGDCAFFALHNLDPTLFSNEPEWTRAAARALLGCDSAPIDLTETGYTHEELRGMFEGKNFVNLPALWAIQLYLSGRVRAETVSQFKLIQYACVSAGGSVHRSIERFYLELSQHDDTSDKLVLHCSYPTQYVASRFIAFTDGVGFRHGHYFNVYPTADVPTPTEWSPDPDHGPGPAVPAEVNEPSPAPEAPLPPNWHQNYELALEAAPRHLIRLHALAVA